ncbi:hypothetical protein [Streptomyces sp. NPDC003857]
MNAWTASNFQRGDTVHIDLGGGITRPYALLAARSRVLEIHDPRTGLDEQRTYDQVAGRTRNGVTDITPPEAGPWALYGSYFGELARSRLTGTTWTCRCSCENPGIWDVCQECQHPHPAP